jgi:hypothetical protein
MMASRGMGAMSPSKMPKGVRKARRDDTDFTQYAEGGKVGCKCHDMAEGGLYANIHAKRARGEKMRKPGQKGAPTAQAFIDSAKTAKK